MTMTTKRFSMTVAAAGLAVLTGCAATQYVAQVPPSLKCEPSASLMAPCPAPTPLKAGLTYREVLDAHLADRQQLQRCAVQQEDLRRAVQTCNARIDAHNAELAKLPARKP
jgi:hypothetical protein